MYINAKNATDLITLHLEDWLKHESGGGKGYIFGISGGKDSTIAAALCLRAVGSENVMGILMPNGVQRDLDDALRVVKILNIPYKIINIEDVYASYMNLFDSTGSNISSESLINISPRIRMTILYAIGQTMNYRVIGTSNADERYVGYCTKHGDMACDVAPLATYSVSELQQIGLELGLPKDLVMKVPEDGLSGSSDEERLGVTYDAIERFRKKQSVSSDEFETIFRLHERALHKLNPTPTFM